MVAGEGRTALPKAVPAANLIQIVQNIAGDVATDKWSERDPHFARSAQPHWITHVCVNEASKLCDAMMLIELHTELAYHNTGPCERGAHALLRIDAYWATHRVRIPRNMSMRTSLVRFLGVAM